MPFINLKSTTAITKQQEDALAKQFVEACKIIGKPECYVMTGFEENCRLHFGDSSENCAYIEVNVYGSASALGYDKMTAHITDTVSSALDILPSRIYVKYSETPYWGFSGSNL